MQTMSSPQLPGTNLLQWAAVNRRVLVAALEWWEGHGFPCSVRRDAVLVIQKPNGDSRARDPYTCSL